MVCGAATVGRGEGAADPHAAAIKGTIMASVLRVISCFFIIKYLRMPAALLGDRNADFGAHPPEQAQRLLVKAEGHFVDDIAAHG